MEEKIRKIYKRLMDRESKEIYKSRVFFSLTGDYSEICHIVASTAQAGEIRKRVLKFSESPVFLWGTGFWADYLYSGFPDIHWSGFVDNYPRIETKNGLPVLPAEKFREEYQSALVVIASTAWHNEIYEQLESWGYDAEKVVDAGAMMLELFERQYFDLPGLPHKEKEVFVDAGCFDGLSIRGFLGWSGGKYESIIAFEPDKKCYEQCRVQLKDVNKLKLIDKGLWSSREVLSFHATGASDSAVSCDGEVQIEVLQLDEVLGDRDVTFLKMDIEGAEKEALLGARKTIKRCRPKLAISVYHKSEDIWELPELILDICPDYKLYMRHYSFRDAETVLYAV